MGGAESSTTLKRQLFSIQLLLAGIGLVLVDYVRVGIIDIVGGIGAFLLVVGLLWGAFVMVTG